jgi:hypothetical protein
VSRIPLDHKPTLLLRIAEIYSKRRYGAVLRAAQRRIEINCCPGRLTSRVTTITYQGVFKA